MKKIINFLKKAGVIKASAGAGSYKNAKDAPEEVIFGGDSYGNKAKKKNKQDRKKRK